MWMNGILIIRPYYIVCGETEKVLISNLNARNSIFDYRQKTWNFYLD